MIRLPLSCLAFLLALQACGDSRHAGGVTDIGNSISGRVVDSSGIPVPTVEVSVLRMSAGSRWISVDTVTSTTNEDGFFRIDELDSGEWLLELKGSNGLARLEKLSLGTHGSDTVSYRLEHTKAMRGRMTGIVGASMGIAGSSLVQKATLGEDGDFLLVNVPAGTFDLCLVDVGPSCIELATRDGRDTLDLLDLTKVDSDLQFQLPSPGILPTHYLGKDFSGVEFPTEEPEESQVVQLASRSLNVQWTSVAPTEDLIEFPLAVRIAAEAENFYLLDSAGSPLSMEIGAQRETDSSQVVWVRIPSISSGQTGVKLWLVEGDSSVIAGDVFRIADGVLAQYHLDESLLDSGAIVQDASDAAHPGIMGQNAFGRDGFLGAGLTFDGADDLVELGRWDPCDTSFTVSLWARWNGPSYRHQILLAKRSLWIPDSSRWQWHFDYTNQVFGSYQVGDTRASFPDALVPTPIWSHLALTYRAESDTVQMWINGVPVDSGKPLILGAGENTLLRLGGSDAGESWDGSLDEVRLERGVRSSSWLRLSWFTQNAASL